MSLPAPVRAKLKPLLLMMSSEHAGEREAAVAAVGRLLAANGSDWHDLASILDETSQPPPPAPNTRPEPRLQQCADGRYEIPAEDLAPLVQAVREQVHCDPWTTQFLESMDERCARFDPVRVSEKQVAVVIRLLGRLPA